VFSFQRQLKDMWVKKPTKKSLGYTVR